jgi:hypothetical protein
MASSSVALPVAEAFVISGVRDKIGNNATLNPTAYSIVIARELGTAFANAEIKTGSITPKCNRHDLQANIKMKPSDKVLVVAVFLSCEDMLIGIKNFAKTDKTISLSGKTLCKLLDGFAQKSGGDKDALLASIHSGLGGSAEINRIEDKLFNLIEENLKPEALKRRRDNAKIDTASRKVQNTADVEKVVENMPA